MLEQTVQNRPQISKSTSSDIDGTSYSVSQGIGSDVESALLSRCAPLGRVPLELVRTHPEAFDYKVIGMRPSWFLICKRGVDILASLLIALVAMPLIPLIALGIRLDSDGPVFYSQVRLGHQGRPFRIWKFRTMRTNAEADGIQFATRDDPRVTRVGSLLRKTRLDEIPQALNLALGDMSLIGPRPERPEIVESTEQILPEFRLRLAVKPGLTGWAQVNYSYAGNVDELRQKLEYDLYYLKSTTARLETEIALRTVGIMLGKKGR